MAVRFNALVVEPESNARTNLLSVLREYGAEAEAVGDICTARRQARARRFDLICADLELSSGLELRVDDLLGRSRNGTSFIATGLDDTLQARGRAVELGALAYLSRPYCEAQLRAVIGKAMALHHCASPSEPPRILMYSHDTIGLGHMRRNSNVAIEILRARPDASVLMLIGCPAGQVFDVPAGVDYVKLPSLVKLSRTEWRPDRLNISGERARALRKRLIWDSIESFEPDVILVDHMPVGVWNELASIIGELRRGPRCPAVMLGLRDILDSPEVTRSAWSKSGADRAIVELYDEVLVYGDPDIFDTISAYDLEELAPGRVHYTGYVTAPRAAPLEIAIHAPSGSGIRPAVLIAGGGGRDAFPLISAALRGLARIPEMLRPSATVIAGPLMAGELRAKLKRQADELSAEYHNHVVDFPARLSASDFLIGMAGYNTMIEAASAGVRSLVVPRTGPSAEQMIRARVFASHGIAEMLLFEAANAAVLGDRLAEVTFAGAREPLLSTNGAHCAATRIVERLHAPSVADPLKLAAS